MLRDDYPLRSKVAALVLDLPRFLWTTRSSSRTGVKPWVLTRNRRERLLLAPDGRGARCDWKWYSQLHIAQRFPRLGFQSSPLQARGGVGVSFVIGHRGLERLPNLLLVLQSIAAQRGAGVECIVVEQSASPEVKVSLPEWVRYIHTPVPPGTLYMRSWAFNVGARAARGDLIVFHDNDLLVPEEYAAELLACYRQGYEVIDIKRFIFYLHEQDTAGMVASGDPRPGMPPHYVIQNAESGGSVAVTREAHFAIGGFDEAFIGWGGEDSEYWQRVLTRRLWSYGSMPLIHLWHPFQPGKRDPENPTNLRLWERSAIAPEERIRELVSLPIGDPHRFTASPALAAPGRSASQAET
jgi:hypothetical protein